MIYDIIFPNDKPNCQFMIFERHFLASNRTDQPDIKPAI